MSSYLPGDTYVGYFPTANPTTGAAQDADSLPTATVYHKGAADGTFTLTVTHDSLGWYKVTGTVPAGYKWRDPVTVKGTATVAGVTSNIPVSDFLMDNVVETGITLPQAIACILATTCNLGNGLAGNNAIYFDPSGTSPRVAGNTDQNGDRSGVSLTPPTNL